MIGDFIVEQYTLSKLKILNGTDTELDRMHVEVIETTLGYANEEFDIDTMLKEIKIPKLDARIPEK